jgi:hypothetical protein
MQADSARGGDFIVSTCNLVLFLNGVCSDRWHISICMEDTTAVNVVATAALFQLSMYLFMFSPTFRPRGADFDRVND